MEQKEDVVVRCLNATCSVWRLVLLNIYMTCTLIGSCIVMGSFEEAKIDRKFVQTTQLNKVMINSCIDSWIVAKNKICLQTDIKMVADQHLE